MVINMASFDNLLNMIKMVKNDYVFVYNCLIIGFDSRASYIKAVQANYIDPNISFTAKTNDLMNFRKQLLPIDEVNITNNRIERVGYETTNYVDLVCPIFNVLDIYNRLIIEYENSSNTYDNLQDNEDFKNILTMKSAEGCKKFTIDKYNMIIFSGMFPVNKSDKVKLVVTNNGSNILGTFIITKKKSINIFLFIRFMTI